MNDLSGRFSVPPPNGGFPKLLMRAIKGPKGQFVEWDFTPAQEGKTIEIKFRVKKEGDVMHVMMMPDTIRTVD